MLIPHKKVSRSGYAFGGAKKDCLVSGVDQRGNGFCWATSLISIQISIHPSILFRVSSLYGQISIVRKQEINNSFVAMNLSDLLCFS
jgi:hypothetical protein